MTAIHAAFPGRLLEAHAVMGSFIAAALGALRDAGVDDPKSVVRSFLDAVDLRDINPFTPARSS